MINGACDLLLLPWYTLVAQYTYCQTCTLHGSKLRQSAEEETQRRGERITRYDVKLINQIPPIIYNLACTSSYSEKARSSSEAMVVCST
jgi:hypothetical protein